LLVFISANISWDISLIVELRFNLKKF